MSALKQRLFLQIVLCCGLASIFGFYATRWPDLLLRTSPSGGVEYDTYDGSAPFYATDDVNDTENDVSYDDNNITNATSVTFGHERTDSTTVSRQVPWLTDVTANSETGLYSAFWDDRVRQDVRPLLRVLGFVSMRLNFPIVNGSPELPARCYVTCPGSARVHEVPYSREQTVLIYKPWIANVTKFFTYVHACDLSAFPCVPDYALLQFGAVGGSSGDIPPPPAYLGADNALSVGRPPREDEAEVKFGSCGPVVFGSVDQYRLVEWLEAMSALGVTQIDLYDSHMNPSLYRVLAHYDHLVTLHPFSLVTSRSVEEVDELTYATAALALTDCMYRNMYRFHWMSVVDLDELIVPTTADSYAELFRQLPSLGRGSNLKAGYKFIHTDFVLDQTLGIEPDVRIPWQLTLVRHRYRFPEKEPVFHPKSIINPRMCTAMHYHVCRGFLPGVRKSLPVDPSLALDCHFRQRLCPDDIPTSGECLEHLAYGVPAPDDRMLRHRDRLAQAVNRSLIALGMETLDPLT